MKDIDANGRRLKLGEFWDEIIEMWESHALPSDFQSQNKWVNAGMTYSQLVEPLDIAYYYRKSEGKGNYFLDGRPKRHKVLQKWLEEKEKTRKARGQMVRTKLPFLIPDSCFWAHVEEALKDLKQGLHQKKKSLQNFENYVTQIIKDRNISSYVFLERSSFMRWWQEYKQVQSPEWKLNSPLYRIMESKSWKG
jgi:enhanced disease susceptibility 1 protein